MNKRLIIEAASLCTLLGAVGVSQSGLAATPSPDVASSSDKVSEETLDLAEVKLAASAHFDQLDKDADGTLDSMEVKGAIGAKIFKATDRDHDGTLDKNEYLALVEKLFKRADVDHDGTLSVAELKSPSAIALKRLLD
jgi:Ca2+-binding EF-hand superfamily protein